jgi:tRNA A-37 threonylcarbamoyl transferase component Bud32
MKQDWEFSRDISLPFELVLADGRTLVCEEILRLLPGRRLVCRARFKDELVLIKLFMGAESCQEASADATAIRAMMAADITTPALRDEIRIQGKPHVALLFDFIPQAHSFRQVWTAAPEEERQALLQKLLKLVAAQHRAGLRQRDFHLNNFLLDARGQLYAIDGGDFVVAGKPVGKSAAMANLEMLFGHLPRRELQRSAAALQGYCLARGWQDGQRVFARVSRGADAFRHRRARRISRKGYRNCSEFVVRRKQNLRICQRRDLPMDELDAWLTTTDLAPLDSDRILKPGNSQTVWQTRLGTREVVVKRYNLKNFLHALRRAFSRSRASRSWENAHRLRAYHVATPRPLAMIEERLGPLRRRAWLITDVAHGVGANRYIPDHPEEGGLRCLADTVTAFGENGLVHGDMKATNFIMSETGVEVIDLDSMRRPRTAPARRARVHRDRQRFLQNWKGDLRERFQRLLDH